MALIVNDVLPTVQYTATASQTTFAYPFAIFADADLKVYQVAAAGTPNDADDILTLTTHYTVTGAGTTAGGNVVLVTGATVGDVITIKRDIAMERTTDYQNLGDLASTSLNDDLDKLVMMAQQNEEAFGRSISLIESTQTPTTFSIDDPVAEYYAVAKADLSGIKWLQLTSSGELSVSVFMQTVLDDTTAGEARTTLDAQQLDADTTKNDVANTFTQPQTFNGASPIVLEGATEDAFETTLAVTDPTADRVVTIKDETGTVALLVDTYVFSQIEGLILSNDTDTDHDINITAGVTTNSTNSSLLTLSSEITKQIDAAWAAGDDAGGLFTGTVAIDTWYHVFIIKKDSDGTIDAGFDTSLTAANIPAGYTAYKWVSAILTDGSANIIPFNHNAKKPDEILFVTPFLDISVGITTTASSHTLSSPIGLEAEAIMNVSISESTTLAIAYLSPLDTADLAPSSTVAPLATVGDAAPGFSDYMAAFRIKTNTSSQIRARSSQTTTTLRLVALGWSVDRSTV